MNKFISYIAVSVAIAATVYTQPAYTLKPSKEELKEPEIVKEVLDNGLTILIKEIHTFPIVSIEARFRIGSANEEEFLGSGISHFVEHMLFKGDIEKEVKSYGGTVNGFTSFDSTGYRLTVESRYFKEALALLAGAVMKPAFEEEEIENERNVILKEINLQKDNPDKRAYQLLWSTIYTTHPYKHPVIGYEDVLKQIKRQDLVSFHKQHYIPNNLVLGICGDVDKDIALKEAEDVFRGYRRRAYGIDTLPEEPEQITKREYEERANVELSRLLIGYHSVPIGHQDLFALDVLASVLGEGESSVLYNRLVEEERTAHAVAVYSYTPKEPGIFFISVLLDEKNIPAVLKAIDEEIKIIKRGKIDKIQLEKAKNRTLTDFVLTHETVQAQAQDLVEGEILVNNPRFSSDYVEGIEGVSLKDIVNVANLYLKDNAQTVVSLLPQLTKEEKPPETPLVKDEIVISKFSLQNGMRILIREDHSLPVVTIKALFKGGVRVEDTDTNGISNITAQMLLGGTKKRKKEDIYKNIEKLGGTIASFSGSNSFGASLTVLRKDLDFGLELLSDILQNSIFPEDKLDNLKTLIFAAIQNRNDDIFESGMRLFKQNLFKEHPYRFTVLGEKSTVETIKSTSILEFYKQFCVPPNLVLAIFGDVDTQGTLAKVEKFFKGFKGELPQRLLGETPKVKLIPFSDKKIMDKEQVLIIAGFKTIEITDPDVYAFSVLSSILSGSDGRLFYSVRDKLGISYTQGVMSVPGIDRGYFLFYIATSKEHLAVGKQLIIDEIERLKNDSVTKEELELAKADVVGSHLRQIQSNRNLALEAGLDELYGLGYDNFKKYTSKIRSITKEDIDRVVKKYFNQKEFTLVTLGPLQDAD